MDAEQVISSLSEIYSRFRIPGFLQMHMLRTGGVAALICDNWKGPKINKTDVIAVSLIHDLGNIAKIDMKTELGFKMMGGEFKRLDYWKEVRAEIVAKYGKDDHEATNKMGAELGLNKRLGTLLFEEGRAFKTDVLSSSNDWELMICSYADFRVSPFGVLSLKDRFADFEKRYEEKAARGLIKHEDYYVENAIGRGMKVEKRLFENIAIKPEQINDQSIAQYIERYQR